MRTERAWGTQFYHVFRATGAHHLTTFAQTSPPQADAHSAECVWWALAPLVRVFSSFRAGSTDAAWTFLLEGLQWAPALKAIHPSGELPHAVWLLHIDTYCSFSVPTTDVDSDSGFCNGHGVPQGQMDWGWEAPHLAPGLQLEVFTEALASKVLTWSDTGETKVNCVVRAPPKENSGFASPARCCPDVHIFQEKPEICIFMRIANSNI